MQNTNTIERRNKDGHLKKQLFVKQVTRRTHVHSQLLHIGVCFSNHYLQQYISNLLLQTIRKEYIFHFRNKCFL